MIFARVGYVALGLELNFLHAPKETWRHSLRLFNKSKTSTR